MSQSSLQVSSVVLGIAGNSPGYLCQTGESRVLEKQEDVQLPRALFPIFVEGSDKDYLSEFPFSESQIRLPNAAEAKVQMEPELALKLGVTYDAMGKVISLKARALTLVNDVTHRNRAITKLAQKKNWGVSSKGVASSEILMDSFDESSFLNEMRLVGLHKSAGKWHLCSQDVSVTEYHLFFEPLLRWLQNCINEQDDTGALHDIGSILISSGQPPEVTIAIGAPCYTPYGETHKLREGDESLVIAYDPRDITLVQIEQALSMEDISLLTQARLCLHQKVVC